MTLEFKNVTKNYGKKQALQSFSQVLQPGVYGILGPNGAGKSTLMNLITDNIKRTSGQILYEGEEILKLGRKFRKVLSYMPQQQGIYEQFSAVRFLYYVAALKEIPRKEATLIIDGKEQKISTGMTLNAEIEIGKRRIIEFFIYPLIKYMDEGVSVR